MAAPIPRKEWRENIRKNYDYLIRELEVKNMLPGLYQNKVINGRELEELEKPQSSRAKVAAELLDMVLKVDRSKYIAFLSVVNNDQQHVIAKLGYQKYFPSSDSDSAPVEQTNYEPIGRDSTYSEEAPISRENWTESLRINHEYLINELQICYVKDELFEDGVITEREADELMSMKTRVKKVSELLGIIRKMDRRKYFPFLKVVYENQPHIVQKLGYQSYFKGSEEEQITGLEQMETGSNQP